MTFCSPGAILLLTENNVQTPQDSSFKTSKPWLKPLLLGFAVVALATIFTLGGYTLAQNQTPKQAIKPTIVASPTPDPLQTWKTNTLANLTFKIPQSWDTYAYTTDKEGRNGIAFNPTTIIVPGDIPSAFYINVDTNAQVADVKKELTYSYTNGHEQPIIINGITGILFEGDSPAGYLNSTKQKFAFFQYKNGVYYLWDMGTTQDSELYFKQILSTFKFTNESQPSILPSPTVAASKTYKDSEIGYQITYPESYKFTKTYGKDIAKLAPTDVVSGIQLDKPYFLATIVLNVINKKDATSLLDWWNKYSTDRSTEKLYQTNYTFKNISSIKKSQSATHNGRNKIIDHIYFLWKDKIWLVSLEYYEEDNTSTELMQVANSLILP